MVPGSQQPPNAYVSFDEFSRMPNDIWLLVMNLLSPVDLLQLAYSHQFFKQLVAASPKSWGTMKVRRYDPGELDAKSYKITKQGKYGPPAKKFLLAYGDEYNYKRYMRGERPPFYAGFCRHVAPDVDRDPAAVDDLFIVLNNATFDQFGYGVDWKMPDASKYKNAPLVRAHTAMLSINGPKQELCRQIATLEPKCMAIHTSAANPLGPVISEVATLMPNLSKAWIHFGAEISEAGALVQIKSPQIVALVSLAKKVRVDGRSKYIANPELLDKFNTIFMPALQTIISQWQDGTREIDMFVLNSQETGQLGRHYSLPLAWAKLDSDLVNVPHTLSAGRLDLHKIFDWPNYCLIRRTPFSEEGLFVCIEGASLALISCGYNFRRDRTYRERALYMNAAMDVASQLEMEKVFGDRNGVESRCEAIVKKWASREPHRSLPTNEQIIDQMLSNWTAHEWPFTAKYYRPHVDAILNTYKKLSDEYPVFD